MSERATSELAAYSRTRPVPRDEESRIYWWYVERALELGFEAVQAAEIGLRRIDLHALETLLERGCSHRLALEILR